MPLFSQRWAVNLGCWLPDQKEFTYLLELLPVNAQAEVNKYKFTADRQRALISRLLQRKCLTTAFPDSFSDILIQRTKGGKPYFASPCNRISAPNCNFNVSHEGDFVVLAAEPLCICGIDVAAPPKARPSTIQDIHDIKKSFTQQLTSAEWLAVTSAGSQALQVQAFQTYWSLKEAFVKARGDGLGFDLGRVEFEAVPSSSSLTQSVTARLDGKALDRWRFRVHVMGDHVVAVALGPPEDVVDAWGGFRATFAKPQLTDDEMQAALDTPRPAFALLSISDIIPVDARDGYAEVGGDVLL